MIFFRFNIKERDQEWEILYHLRNLIKKYFSVSNLILNYFFLIILNETKVL